MSLLFKTLLSIHVIAGILGVVSFYAVWFNLLRQRFEIRTLKGYSLAGAIFLICSWLAGGYYYLKNYGAAVRDVVRAGPNPWAHNLIMETKEHIFLFLPILAVVITIVIWLNAAKISEDQNLKKQLMILSGIVAWLGIIITLFGAVISGSVRII